MNKFEEKKVDKGGYWVSDRVIPWSDLGLIKNRKEIFWFECPRQSDGVDVGHTPEHRENVDDHMKDENLGHVICFEEKKLPQWKCSTEWWICRVVSPYTAL